MSTVGASIAQWLAFLLVAPARCTEFDSQHFQKIIRKKLLMLLRLINGAAYRKVDSGMKMLIEPT